MLQKLKLGVKFTLIISVIFIAGMLASGFVLSHTAQQQAEKLVADQAKLMLETMNAVRFYTSNNVQPQLDTLQESQPEFIAETVPAYSARVVFEDMRKRGNYEDFLYKEATLNPTNPLDRADEFETKVVRKFRLDAKLTEVQGFRERTTGGDLFYLARPLAVTNQSCLVCHSVPSAAPPSLIKTYGAENGFGWKLGEVIAAQMIYVPADMVMAIYRRQLLLGLGIFSGIFALVLVILNRLLQKTVVQPIYPMAQLAQRIIQQDITPEEAEREAGRRLDKVAKGENELSQLARVFQMMVRAVVTREQALTQQIESLTNLLDRSRRLRQDD
ncbi:c-type heme family protein [Pantanalinema rosaneae CENA516]|uniref:Tll0287-like domain-containing protein n=1 Tax=Pantanalinema rosaneae TaxID=1620701 RepID=UPI003D6E71CE